MSASRKKTTSKPATSPAPATKSASAKSLAKPIPSPVQSTTPAPVALLAPSAPPAATPALVVKPLESKPVLTSIAAQVDVGFGNRLFIRGEGPGLSWEKGLIMECLESDQWRTVLTESAPAYTFKFLVNDETWSAGPDFTAACGASVTLKPEF